MRFLYANTQNVYPQDRHLIDGMRELGHEIVEICDKDPGYEKRIEERIRKAALRCDAVIVGFPSPLLVFAARKGAMGKPVIFNAAYPQCDANIVSRKDRGLFFYRVLKWWILDFASFHLSSKVFLESRAQIDFVAKTFFVPRRKLGLSYSGLDEKVFFLDPTIKKADEFTVLFRGRFLPESGILTVIESAKLLENKSIRFRIIGAGFMYREVNALMKSLAPKNLEIIGSILPSDELRKKMLECHVSLGQMADHPRLARTLPCKLFESLALGLPYLTGRNKAVFEMLQESITCIAANPGNARDLADKVLLLRDDPAQREAIAKAGHQLYKDSLTSRALASSVVDFISKP